MAIFNKQISMPDKDSALPGREQTMTVADAHFVNGNIIKGPFPAHLSQAIFGLGCFWGAEKKFWLQDGVFSTAVGYAAGYTNNPSYQEVCSGMTGHNEVVLVVYDESVCGYEQLVKLFFESHNPTQGMQQGNDMGTQYRSGIYTCTLEQMRIAEALKAQYQKCLTNKSMAEITTEIIVAEKFYYAEDYHQQYLAKNPAGYCGLGGTGVKFD